MTCRTVHLRWRHETRHSCSLSDRLVQLASDEAKSTPLGSQSPFLFKSTYAFVHGIRSTFGTRTPTGTCLLPATGQSSAPVAKRREASSVANAIVLVKRSPLSPACKRCQGGAPPTPKTLKAIGQTRLVPFPKRARRWPETRAGSEPTRSR